jgi:hypothetical protein
LIRFLHTDSVNFGEIIFPLFLKKEKAKSSFREISNYSCQICADKTIDSIKKISVNAVPKIKK